MQGLNFQLRGLLQKQPAFTTASCQRSFRTMGSNTIPATSRSTASSKEKNGTPIKKYTRLRTKLIVSIVISIVITFIVIFAILAGASYKAV